MLSARIEAARKRVYHGGNDRTSYFLVGNREFGQYAIRVFIFFFFQASNSNLTALQSASPIAQFPFRNVFTFLSFGRRPISDITLRVADPKYAARIENIHCSSPPFGRNQYIPALFLFVSVFYFVINNVFSIFLHKSVMNRHASHNN